MPLNAYELSALLKGMSPKALLASLMILGFVVSLPFWLASTPEQKQHMSMGTTAKRVVEKNVGPLDLQPDEQKSLRKMLKKKSDSGVDRFRQMVWMKDIKQVIKPWVPDVNEAENVARWVYVYSVRFKLSPELILAVIAVESQFDHFAISNVGARGLMQIMPFWKKELGSKDDNLFDIETNIRYGSAILRIYLDRYGKLPKALAAYNGSLGKGKYPAKVFLQMKRFKATKKDLMS